MKRFITTLVLLYSIVFGLTGCGKAKALKTVREADELAAKLLIYGRNIAKANNASFDAGNIPAPIHLATNKAADVYIQGVAAFVQSIEVAKKAIAAGSDATDQIDLLKAIFDREVVAAATALVGQVAALPPGIADRIAGWVAAIQLALVSFRGLFAEAYQLAEVNSNA